MFLKSLLLIVAGLGFGFLSSAGVFTVFISVGLVPRFADKTHTAYEANRYENWIVLGAVIGCIFSAYYRFFYGGDGWKLLTGLGISMPPLLGNVLLLIYGLFAGIFVGCIAIAIAEALNTIPIFVRRISLGKGIGIVLLGVALGKTAGSLVYFLEELMSKG